MKAWQCEVFDEAGRLYAGTAGERWRYRWRHRSGAEGEREACFESRLAFLACVARWNGSQPGIWQYWPAEAGMVGGAVEPWR
jgi:hypothetical protein